MFALSCTTALSHAGAYGQAPCAAACPVVCCWVCSACWVAALSSWPLTHGNLFSRRLEASIHLQCHNLELQRLDICLDIRAWFCPEQRHHNALHSCSWQPHCNNHYPAARASTEPALSQHLQTRSKQLQLVDTSAIHCSPLTGSRCFFCLLRTLYPRLPPSPPLFTERPC